MRFTAWRIARTEWRGYDLTAIISGIDQLSRLTPRYNVALTQEHPVLAAGEVRLSRFGIRGPEQRLLGNVRSDKLGGYWRRHLGRRVAIPVNGFYEWTADKQPWYFTHRELPVLCLAGVQDEAGFAIITTEPSEDVAPIHDRMPAILEPAALTAWLDPATSDPAVLAATLPAGRLEARRVGKAVGNTKNEGPQLIEQAVLE